MYKNLIDVGLLIVFIITVAMLIININKVVPTGKWYDCSISEISPDFPIELKQECRKLRSEAYKNGRI